jgi:DNA-binding MarR family transcriptional regulator
MRTRGVTTGAGLPDIECACATLRRAARLLTQLYDEELRPHLQASQFALLMALDRRPRCNQSMLSRALAFDKTTLSRNLGLMERNGWIEYAAAGDRRERGFRLTAAGRKLLRTARPGWQRAQDRLRSSMTGDRWDAMWRVLHNLTNAAYHARSQKGDTS